MLKFLFSLLELTYSKIDTYPRNLDKVKKKKKVIEKKNIWTSPKIKNERFIYFSLLVFKIVEKFPQVPVTSHTTRTTVSFGLHSFYFIFILFVVTMTGVIFFFFFFFFNLFKQTMETSGIIQKFVFLTAILSRRPPNRGLLVSLIGD